MHTSHHRIRREVILALAAALIAAPGCNATPSAGSTNPGSSGQTGSSGAGSSSGASSSGGSSSGASSGGSTANCVGASSRAQRQPVDLFVMLDRSPSMEDKVGTSTVTKWAAVTAALGSFVDQPLEATSVGLGYFPIEDPTAFMTGGVSCAASRYAVPVVEMGPLAQTASQIRSSIGSQALSSGTPTSAALQGAIDHARTWAADARNANHAVVVVLATDGDPTLCDLSLANIDRIAAAGLSSAQAIRTFVIGVGPLKANLDGIAAAGGTTSAFIVDTNGTVSTQFFDALNSIRNKAVGCSYVIPAPPAGEKLDFTKVNVDYQPGGAGTAVPFSKVAGAAACLSKTDAWHYDDDAAPTSVVLCPGTCSKVEADAAAAVEIVLGCTTAAEW